MSKYEPRRSRTPSPKPSRQRFNEEWGLRDISHRAAILSPVGAGVIALAGLAVGSELSGGGSSPVVASHHVLTGRPPAHVQQPVLSASLMPPVLAAKHVAAKRASTKAHVRVARHAARSAPQSSTVWVASHSTVAAVPAVSHARSAASAHVATHSVARSSSPTVVASVPAPSSTLVVARHPSPPSHQQQPTGRRTTSASHGSSRHTSPPVRSAPTSSKGSTSASQTSVSQSTTAVTAQATAAPRAAAASTPAPAPTAATQPAAAAMPAPQSFSQAKAVTPSSGGDAPAPTPVPTPAPQTFSQANTVTPATGGDTPAPAVTATPVPAPKPAPKPVTKSANGWTSTVVDKPTKASVGSAGLILSLISVGVGGGVAISRRRRGLDWRTGR